MPKAGREPDRRVRRIQRTTVPKIPKIESVINEFDTPEDINNSPNTAPSKRLLDAIPGYNKVLYGRMLAESIGLDSIRSKCPMFNEWLTKLENI